MKRDPLDDAHAAGLRVEITSFGKCAPIMLFAEYDRAQRTIRINADAVACVRLQHGAAEADTFCAAAVAHELYHHEVAEGMKSSMKRAPTEREAHAYALATYGIDALRYERALC